MARLRPQAHAAMVPHSSGAGRFMAGGGVRPGISYGETDDYSYNIVKDPVHVRDFNATILHCLGIDHSKFAYKFQGLDQKLTSPVAAYVVQGLLA